MTMGERSLERLLSCDLELQRLVHAVVSFVIIVSALIRLELRYGRRHPRG